MSTRSNRQRSVNDRIRVFAASEGMDANRVRRSLVFQRLLARLGPHGFVLKGGYCLEVRLTCAARATKDLDLVGRIATTADADNLLDALDEILDGARLDDGFTVRVGRPVRLRDEDGAAHAWRLGVTAHLDGAEFERVRLDLVGQIAEVSGATEPLVVPPPVAIEGLGDVVIDAVDVHQHAAEKYHAYTRVYAHDRPSSRVKDLVDLVLLIESGLLMDPRRLRARLEVVCAERDEGPPAPHLPQPPGDWARPYAAMAAELDLTAATTAAAYDLVAQWYAAALTEGTTP